MRSLYIFGQSPIQQDSQPDLQQYAPVLQAPSLSILWASWCDLIVAHSNSPHLVYHGTSLTPAQARLISQLSYPAQASEAPIFFGRALDHGLRGFLVPSARQITIFNPCAGEAKGNGEITSVVETVSFQDANFEIVDVRFTSGESVFVSMKTSGCSDEKGAIDVDMMVLQFPSLQDFLKFLRSKGRLYDQMSDSSHPFRVLTSTCPLELRTNATTLTALSSRSGQIYTFAPDPRFPKCLGRHVSSAAEAEPVSYLSEVGITKIASGGYYTCAISASSSSDSCNEQSGGELYLWGQAPPGTGRELSVLQTSSSATSDDQDDFVCCVELEIDGVMAEVTDVAVGWGHVLVAVEATRGNRKDDVSRALFAAGCNSRRQLGVEEKTGSQDFREEFTEVKILKGQRVVQMECSGWSSYIVVEEDEC